MELSMDMLSIPYGHALSQLDSTNMFKSTPKGEYANTLVFTPPIDRQESTIRAIEALRLSIPQSSPELPVILNQTLLQHGCQSASNIFHLSACNFFQLFKLTCVF